MPRLTFGDVMGFLFDLVVALLLIPFDVASARRLREEQLQRDLEGLRPDDTRAVFLVLRAFDPLDVGALEDGDSLYEDLARRASAAFPTEAWHDIDATARRLEAIAADSESAVRVTANRGRMRMAVRRAAHLTSAST